MGDLKRGAILFADLAGSTSLYESMGNVVAAQAVRAALDQMAERVRDNAGQVIKTVGDAVLAWFEAADAAAQAAIAIQHSRAGATMAVRAGFHYGEAVHEPEDIFGDAVNVAARLAASASAGEILTSRETVSRLSEPLASQARPLTVERFKGKMQSMQVFQVLWDPDREVTRAVATAEADRLLQEMRALRLVFGRRKLVLTPRYMPFTFGRDKAASLPVNSTLVSRSHARLDFHHGKFVLLDCSTNGTFVAPDGSDEIQLRRESMPLLGRGVFALGGRPRQNPDVCIEYAFE